MTDEELRDRWMEENGAPPSHREGCPSPEVLLDLAERGLVAGDGGEDPDAERTEVLLHLARCSACRDDVAVAGALLRAARDEEAGAPSRGGGASGGRGNAVDFPPGGLRRRPSLALAASVLLAVGVGGGVLVRWAATGGGEPILRGGAGDLPAAVASCSQVGIVDLSWAPVPGAERYRVEIFTDVGDLVMQEELEGNSIRLVLPEGSSAGGAALQQMVEAELPGGTRLTSPATPLPPGCLPPR